MRLLNSTAQRFDPSQWMAFYKCLHSFIGANFIIDETARRLFRAATAKLGQIQQLQTDMVLVLVVLVTHLQASRPQKIAHLECRLTKPDGVLAFRTIKRLPRRSSWIRWPNEQASEFG